MMVIQAPETIGSLASATIEDMGVSSEVTPIIHLFITGILYIVILLKERLLMSLILTKI